MTHRVDDEGRSSPQGRSSFAWLWYLSIAGLLVMGGISLIRPTTTYKLLALDAGGFAVGVNGALYALLPLFCIFTIGKLAQTTPSLKPLLLIGSVTVAGGAAVIALATSVIMVAAGTAVVGMGQLTFAIAGQAVIARFATNKQLDMAFGWFTAGFSTGQMIGPLLGGILLDGTVGRSAREAVDLTLWVGAGGSVLVLLVLLAARRSFRTCPERNEPEPASGHLPSVDRYPNATDSKDVAEHESKGSEQRPTILQILRTRRLKSHMVASIALLSMVDMLQAFMPLVGEAAGVSPFWTGVFLSTRAGASVLSRAALPLMRRMASRDTLVLLALWISGLSLALLPLVVNQVVAAIVLMVFSGFFLGIGQPLTMSQVTRAVPDEWRSPTLAVRLMGNRVGQVAVPLGAGALAGVWGPAAAIWLACGILLGSGAEKLVFYRSQR